MIWLITGILAGSFIGIIFGKQAEVLKPIGDIFLNLLFVAVVPLVFFAISSAIAGLSGEQQLSKIMTIMSGVFLVTVLLAASLTILALYLFPIEHHADAVHLINKNTAAGSLSGDQITQLFTTGEFYQLLSRRNMLALIIFALLSGFGTLRAGELGSPFANFLIAGNEVFKNVFVLIMKLGPIGLGAYFAYQVAQFGPALFGTYGHVMAVGYGVSIFYYGIFFSIYSFIAGGSKGIRTYWKNNIIPSATAVGTCSSIATIPAMVEDTPIFFAASRFAGMVAMLLQVPTAVADGIMLFFQ